MRCFVLACIFSCALPGGWLGERARRTGLGKPGGATKRPIPDSSMMSAKNQQWLRQRLRLCVSFNRVLDKQSEGAGHIISWLYDTARSINP